MTTDLMHFGGGAVVPTRPNRPTRKVIRAIEAQEHIELAKVDALASVNRAAVDHTAFLALQRKAYASALPESADLLGLITQAATFAMAERIARANHRLG